VEFGDPIMYDPVLADLAREQRRIDDLESKATAIEQKVEQLLESWSAKDLIDNLSTTLQDQIQEELGYTANKLLEKEAEENFTEPDIDFPY
jgi:hypothetical protein